MPACDPPPAPSTPCTTTSVPATQTSLKVTNFDAWVQPKYMKWRNAHACAHSRRQEGEESRPSASIQHALAGKLGTAPSQMAPGELRATQAGGCSASGPRMGTLFSLVPHCAACQHGADKWSVVSRAMREMEFEGVRTVGGLSGIGECWFNAVQGAGCLLHRCV